MTLRSRPLVSQVRSLMPPKGRAHGATPSGASAQPGAWPQPCPTAHRSWEPKPRKHQWPRGDGGVVMVRGAGASGTAVCVTGQQVPGRTGYGI